MLLVMERRTRRRLAISMPTRTYRVTVIRMQDLQAGELVARESQGEMPYQMGT
jgi:hypothetical protein